MRDMGIRSIVERLSRGRKHLRFVRVHGRKVELYVSADAQLKYLKRSGSWDEDLLQLAEYHVLEEADVWDIGANVGVFAFAAAIGAKNARVFAFEPDTFLADLMRQSRLRNGLENVQVLPVAVSSRDGFSKFLVARRGRASNALESAGGRSQMGGIRDHYVVPTFSGATLRASLDSRPGLIKIDVEGAELEVLEGLRPVILECRPKIYIEVGRSTSEATAKFFSELGYQAVELGERSQTTMNRFFVPIQ